MRIPLPACLLLVLGTLLLVTACSTPVKAPVTSRENAVRHSGPLPSHYRVKRGDTLYSIAWRYGLGFRKLASWNRIRPPYTIYPGQRLRLKPPASPRRRTAQRHSRPSKAGNRARRAAKPAATSARPGVRGGGRQAQKKHAAAGGNTRLRWRWPTRGRVVQKFVRGDPLRKGVKIAGRLGQPVLAAEAGKVVYAGSGLIGYGRLIIIKHNKNYLSAYGHNRRLLVREGDTVSRGQRVAEMGRNGA
ncbi:MAG TPA: LysM peptidoglycan-binding domain-containing protein, partial [Sedimenticola sp.]|nr:LysM peptidoglycan-binding domain-containing protein [Sedimenticola sp.]